MLALPSSLGCIARLGTMHYINNKHLIKVLALELMIKGDLAQGLATPNDKGMIGIQGYF